MIFFPSRGCPALWFAKTKDFPSLSFTIFRIKNRRGEKVKITKTKFLGKLLEEKFKISSEMDYSLKFLSFRAIEISRQNLLLPETDVL